MSKYKRYSYKGPIYYNGRKIADKTCLYTMATSWTNARRNFVYKAANGDWIWNYDIADSFVVESPVATSGDKSVIEEPEVVRCDHCNTQLNPMGDCPVCDYGEYDLLD